VKPPSIDELKFVWKNSTESEDKINMQLQKHVELATAPQFDVIIKTTI
jgi:hypothetical protein